MMSTAGARDGGTGPRPRYMAVRPGVPAPNGHHPLPGASPRPGGPRTRGPGMRGLVVLLGALAALSALLWAVAAALVWVVYRLHGGG